MSVDLADDEYTASLKRTVTPLGSTIFDSVGADDWTGYLTDAFWDARLDGFMVGYTIADDTEIVSESGGADLGREWVSLVVLYAGIKILTNKILNTNTKFSAKAGPVEFAQESSATMLAEMLKQLAATKNRIIAELDEIGESTTLVLDGLSVRTFEFASYWGSPELTG